MKICVSTLIPGEEGEQYLLSKSPDQDWRLPFGEVKKDESIKTAAERVATEVRV